MCSVTCSVALKALQEASESFSSTILLIYRARVHAYTAPFILLREAKQLHKTPQHKHQCVCTHCPRLNLQHLEWMHNKQKPLETWRILPGNQPYNGRPVGDSFLFTDEIHHYVTMYRC